ncbi:hypothetical protein PILCRDRAFT_811763 [Piloderma croceum F 1598]|uniref:Hepatocellular carcinoma-associated antigen 59 domain-containing protein n=1 Tax=Piloderma croceum (strain F 1598) TaxID=765440 RepID=A0A0C3GKW6_PILCF|nr:hypothetical protein PILCRDRAFT_811763 [Piloderma croceum F 1598]
MIKKRTRPQPRKRETSLEVQEQPEIEEEADGKLPLADLIELRRLKKLRQGIDASKLNKGDVKKKRKLPKEDEDMDQGGLRKGVPSTSKEVVDDEEDDDKEARARRVVRNNNFTQQTNALDVDKHMMAYIEENLKIRSRPLDPVGDKAGPADPQEELYRVSERWKSDKKVADEGSVTNSLAMLTAIPEVDLGMDTRLKNIEETEKAKRVVAEDRKGRPKLNNDEEHLAASRFYRPNLKQKSDADILRDAKLEAMGLPPQEEAQRNYNGGGNQMATDEVVMERFKKRMRK